MRTKSARFPGAAWQLVAPLAAIVALAGCDSKSPLAPVSGQVTHAGQAVSGANVMFQPEDRGIASGGITGPDGRFELLASDDRRAGAVPGKHLVSIMKPAAEPPAPEGGSAQPPRPPEPPLEFSTSVEVNAEGPNDFTFDIP